MIRRGARRCRTDALRRAGSGSSFLGRKSSASCDQGAPIGSACASHKILTKKLPIACWADMSTCYRQNYNAYIPDMLRTDSLQLL
eukprot:5533892-Pleurochrysis_carterae.AAC.5